MLWLHLHFPRLQLDSMYNDGHDKPMAIVEPKRNRLIQLNTVAQQQGLKLGMGIGAAAALCSELQVHPYDDAIEKTQLHHIANWLYLTTADIHLQAPHDLLLRVTPMLNLYGSLNDYWQTLEQQLQRLNLHYQFSTGYSPLAAKALALSGYNQVIEHANTLTSALQKCDLAFTPLAKKVNENLRRVGVNQIGSLLTLPLSDIAKRFELDVVTYIGRLTGQLHHPVDFYLPPAKFKQGITLSYEVTQLDRLSKPLTTLLARLEYFLRLRDKRAQQILICLICRDTDPLTVHVGAGHGEYLADKWLALALLTFESIRLTNPVIGLTIEAKQLIELGNQHGDMFSASQSSTSPLELVACLQAKLGSDKVMSVQTVNDPRPENASRLIPALKSHDGVALAQLPRLRPSFLLPSPRVLQEKITLLHGPERIQSGWWDGKPIQRDYFIGRSQAGHWLWVFRTPKQHWYVHGIFS